jgi:4-hydroxybenzoate polyprenyltransferase
MLEKTKKLFFISRPISWPNTAYPFAAGYLVSGGSVDALFFIATLYFLGPYNLLMYGVNDVFDYESDIRNPRKGGIEGMKEQKSLHPTIMKAVVITNRPFIFALLLLGTVVSAAVLALVIFLVVAYSVKGLRFKERPVLDSITSSMHFVGPLLFALSLTGFAQVALPYVVAFFLWGVASHAFGAVQDIIPDREGKLASVATVFGAKLTMQFSFILYCLAAGIIALQVFPINIVGALGLLYAANIASYLKLTDNHSGKANAPWRRFISINLFVGFVVTMVILFTHSLI